MIDFENGSIIRLRRDKKPREEDIAKLLISGENVIGSYTALRDFVVFTNKRIIAVNVQGATGSRKDYTSLPYRKISAFSVETSGVFDMDTELELYFSGLGKVTFDFTGSSDIVAIGRAISVYALDGN